MRVYVDIQSLIGHMGIAVGYNVQAGYEIDEHDDLDIPTLRQMNKDIEKVVQDALAKSMEINNAHKEATVSRTYKEV